MNRQKLEELRDSYKPGTTVKIVKNTWDRPGTVGRYGTVAENTDDQFTPSIRVRLENGSIYTFSPDDVKEPK